jgi:hypothetical protein
MQISKFTILSAVAALSATTYALTPPSNEVLLEFQEMCSGVPTLEKRDCIWSSCNDCNNNQWQCQECADGTGDPWGDLIVCLSW